MAKVGIVMGSISDLSVVTPAVDILKEFGVEVEVRVMSAHRTPNEAHDFAQNAISNGIEVLISAAGKAAHLGGVLASFTTLPVIGLPIKSSTMDGMDSLLSTVQMPAGGLNAGLLAIQMLAIKYPELAKKLAVYKEDMAKKVIEADKKLQDELNK